jgi:hypothetical protein
MPQRYHFDLVNHKTVTDHGGQILEDDVKAIEVSDHLASEVAKNRPELLGRGYKILVTDAEGNEVHRSPLDRMDGFTQSQNN